MTKNATNEIVITRMFNATPERVFKAWTDPEQIRHWWGPKGFSAPVVKIDLRKGGKYLYCMRGEEGDFSGKDFWSGGVIKEIVPNKRLVITDHFADEHGNKVDPTKYGFSPDFPKESEVIVTFEAEHGKTKLTIHYAPETQAAHDAMLKTGMNDGWNSSLDKLQELVEQ
jgi:uncharacterized protein YndB with AHSA1/START domain